MTDVPRKGMELVIIDDPYRDAVIKNARRWGSTELPYEDIRRIFDTVRDPAASAFNVGDIVAMLESERTARIQSIGTRLIHIGPPDVEPEDTSTSRFLRLKLFVAMLPRW